MGQLTVRKLDDELIRRLKIRAALHGRSAEAEHREILRHPESEMQCGARRHDREVIVHCQNPARLRQATQEFAELAIAVALPQGAGPDWIQLVAVHMLVPPHAVSQHLVTQFPRLHFPRLIQMERRAQQCEALQANVPEMTDRQTID